jgi:hypothetical protein
MKKMMTGWTAAALLLVSAGSLLAHHSLTQFDTAKAVTVKGVVVRFEQVNPHSILFVDQTGTDGQIQRWAVEGPGLFQLRRIGFVEDALKVGDLIEVCGYVMKDGIESQRTVSTEPISLSLKATTPKSMSGRLLTAEYLVMPDGEKRSWGDYGHHKCLGAGYLDIHSR